MDAVNLIPEAGIVEGRAFSLSPQTLALIGSLLAILIAVALYVSALNSVTSRQNELAQVTSSVAKWRAAGSAFAPYSSQAEQLAAQLVAVQELAATRYPWPRLLDQIGRAMPANTALSSLQSGAGSTVPAAATASSPQSLQLSGCAKSQPVVADTMQRLRLVQGVSSVALNSDSDTSANGTSSAPVSGSVPAGGASCAYPVQFQMSLTLTSGGASSTSSAGGGQ
jgi:Tfp pilus assembly protein PilN